MSMLTEFKNFAMRGNVIDMAVGIIIGVAFGKIVTSLVNDVVMPPVGMLLGRMDFSNLMVTIGTGATIKYGVFLNTVINFIIVAFCMFLIIKGMNKAKRPAPVAAPTTKECPYCLMTVPINARKCGHCASAL